LYFHLEGIFHLVYDFFSSLSSKFACCYASIQLCVIEIKLPFAFSKQVDTEEEEEEEDKEDSPAPTDSVSRVY